MPERMCWRRAKINPVEERRKTWTDLYRDPKTQSVLNRTKRSEVNLDRKLERTLSMLLRLKEMRHGSVAG